jgi:hypothetical protein
MSGRGRARGRSIIAAGLVGFVLVAAAVVWRRGYGGAHAAEIRELDRRRAQLADEKAGLERRVRQLSSRTHLGPLVEDRLGMRVPDDSLVVVLPAPATSDSVAR